MWVVYFSVAALPLFGLGQALIAAEDVERRRSSFWLMIVYVGCGLGLLLTTCFLSLRRYLRQRRLQMPRAMTGMWLMAGGMLIATLLLIGAVLPRPDAEYSIFSFSPTKSPKRGASKYALKGGRSGEGEGRPGANDPERKKDDADSGGDKGQQKGERGDGRRSKERRVQDDRMANRAASSDNQGKNKAQGQNQNKGDPDSGRDRQAKKDNDKQAQNDNTNRRSSDKGERRSEKEASERDRSGSRSSSKLSPSALRDVVGRIAPDPQVDRIRHPRPGGSVFRAAFGFAVPGELQRLGAAVARRAA